LTKANLHFIPNELRLPHQAATGRGVPPRARQFVHRAVRGETGSPLATFARWRLQMFILGWIVFGLIVGALAKLVMPGRDAGGIIVTMLLGIAGAVLGGFAGRALGLYQEGEAAGFLMSFLGAVVLLALYRMMVGRRTIARP
jgi:uncharacterized membrane protein YeaQ/YmgE (transglycosylase-associated protein family)